MALVQALPALALQPCAPKLTASYVQVQAQLEVESFFSNLRTLCQPKKLQEKQITPKMRGKLLQWLQKLTTITFKHSLETYLTAVVILDQYLERSNQAPSNLQLLGCSALFIASKLREETIVAPECYVLACCSIFTREHLLTKEKAMYGCVDWKRLKSGVLKGLRLGCNSLEMKDALDKSWEYMSRAFKEQQCLAWPETKLLYAVLSITQLSLQTEYKGLDLFPLLKDL